jgi:plasmid stabilization system protein ParE
VKLPLHRADDFNADFDRQYRWYLEQAGEDLAARFLDRVLLTLRLLGGQPDLGRRRKFRHPALRDLRSFRLNSPFDRILIFYRVKGDSLEAWRLMYGTRDLPRRLVEPPESSAD